jgi:hypothetical protein
MGLEARAVLPLLLFTLMRSIVIGSSPSIVASLTSNFDRAELFVD